MLDAGSPPKLTRAPRVWFLAADTVGAWRLRSLWPAAALRGHGQPAKAVRSWPWANADEVLIVHQPISSGALEQMRLARARGAAVLIQTDDDLACIPASNPRKASTTQRLCFERAIIEADGLIGSSAALLERYGPLASATTLCPNYLPAAISEAERPRAPGPVRVGWSGTLQTHRDDLEWLAPEASRAVRDAEFVTVGDRRVPALLGLPDAGARGFTADAEALYRTLARADIGIVPLAPSRFNEARSWLKALEFVSIGRPVVAADLPEQRALLAGTGAGILVGTAREMADAVQDLVHDAALRETMSAAALDLGRSLAIEHRTCWEDAIETLAAA